MGKWAILSAAVLCGVVGGYSVTVSAQEEEAAAVEDRCLSPGAVRDKDIKRHAEVLAGDGNLCLSQFPITENGLDWVITLVENTKHADGPAIVLLHDNENAAFDTAMYSVRRYGGKIVAIEAGDRREFQGQDPNRNFGMTAAATAPCKGMRRKPAPVFTRLITDLAQSSSGFILTLHNNADGHSGNGGSGGISAARDSAVMNGEMAPDGGDEDDAILLAGTTPLEENAKARKAVKHFHKKGVNVIYEHVRAAGNDCSFSNYVVLNNLGAYFNVEAQHGHVAQQRAMLDVLMKYKRVKVRDRSVK